MRRVAEPGRRRLASPRRGCGSLTNGTFPRGRAETTERIVISPLAHSPAMQRGVWGLLVVGGVLALVGTSVSLGGLVVAGAGTGTAFQSDGDVCRDAPFNVKAVFLPNNKGILEFSWVKVVPPGDTTCFGPVSSGGSAALGTVSLAATSIPPVSYTAPCTGNEAQGLACQDFISIGPYAGPGSRVWLLKKTAEEVFQGIFVAT